VSYLGERPIEIGGERLTLVFDWAALARIRADLGSDGQTRAVQGDLEALAAVVAHGLARRHPDWTAERVQDSSPAVMPTIAAVDAALLAAYFGPSGPPAEIPTSDPPQRTATRLRRLFARLIGLVSRRPNSGD
jgi:hypothetical protein